MGVDNPYNVTRGNIKLRLLVDVYLLKTVRKRTKQTRNDLCPLCNGNQVEDREYFLLRCSVLESVRVKQATVLTSNSCTKCVG